MNRYILYEICDCILFLCKLHQAKSPPSTLRIFILFIFLSNSFLRWIFRLLQCILRNLNISVFLRWHVLFHYFLCQFVIHLLYYFASYWALLTICCKRFTNWLFGSGWAFATCLLFLPSFFFLFWTLAFLHWRIERVTRNIKSKMITAKNTYSTICSSDPPKW